MKINKRLIYNRIKTALGMKTDSDLAEFLGISPQTLSNSCKRNSTDWDNLLSKCEQINLNWLLTGRGEMLRNTANNDVLPDCKSCEEKERTIAAQEIIIETQKDLIEFLKTGKRESDARDVADVAGAV